MSKGGENPKQYDLEERTYQFARCIRQFVKLLARTLGNFEDAKQVIRSSGSVAANYLEANEALSKKDFVVRIKICRKEAKESRLWLRLLDLDDRPQLLDDQAALIREAEELTSIFGAIFRKSE
jgi:four helix bundle protein